jgi:hypothetical protein
MSEKNAFNFYQLKLAKVEGSHPLRLMESRFMKALQSRRILSQKVVGFDGVLRGFQHPKFVLGCCLL